MTLVVAVLAGFAVDGDGFDVVVPAFVVYFVVENFAGSATGGKPCWTPHCIHPLSSQYHFCLRK